MYPAMEKHLGQEGTDLTDIDRAQHQAVCNPSNPFKPHHDADLLQVKEDLYTLQSMSPSSPTFIPTLDTLLKDLHDHIEHEKNEDMPRLEKLLSREESKSLADQFVKTKRITPTRSHPSAPNKPYFENFAAMLAAPLDKFADLMRTFPEEEDVLKVSPKAVL